MLATITEDLKLNADWLTKTSWIYSTITPYRMRPIDALERYQLERDKEREIETVFKVKDAESISECVNMICRTTLDLRNEKAVDLGAANLMRDLSKNQKVRAVLKYLRTGDNTFSLFDITARTTDVEQRIIFESPNIIVKERVVFVENIESTFTKQIKNLTALLKVANTEEERDAIKNKMSELNNHLLTDQEAAELVSTARGARVHMKKLIRERKRGMSAKRQKVTRECRQWHKHKTRLVLLDVGKEYAIICSPFAAANVLAGLQSVNDIVQYNHKLFVGTGLRMYDDYKVVDITPTKSISVYYELANKRNRLMRLKQERLKELSERGVWDIGKQRKFLEFLKKTGSISTTCKYLGITRKTAYDYMARNELFQRAVRLVESQLRGDIEERLLKSVLEGDEIVKYDGQGNIISKTIKPSNPALLMRVLDKLGSDFGDVQVVEQQKDTMSKLNDLATMLGVTVDRKLLDDYSKTLDEKVIVADVPTALQSMTVASDEIEDATFIEDADEQEQKRTAQMKRWQTLFGADDVKKMMVLDDLLSSDNYVKAWADFANDDLVKVLKHNSLPNTIAEMLLYDYKHDGSVAEAVRAYLDSLIATAK